MFKVPIISLVKVSKDTNSPAKRKTVLTIRCLYLQAIANSEVRNYTKDESGIPNSPGTVRLLFQHLSAVQNLSPSIFSLLKKGGLRRIVDQVEKKMIGPKMYIRQIRFFVDIRVSSQRSAVHDNKVGLDGQFVEVGVGKHVLT